MARTQDSTPLDTLWQASAIVWVLLASEGLAAVLALAPAIQGNRWVYFGLASLVVQWVALATLGALYACRGWLATWRPARVAYLALVLMVLITWLLCGMGWLLLGDIWPMTTEERLRFLLRITGIAVTVGLLGLAAFQNHWRARQLAVRAKQSELESLQARIRPHFLFNTLNTGAALVHQRPGEAERLLLDLADLFRAALAGPAEIELADELALAQRYLEIEALRFEDRLRVEWRLPEPLPAVLVPTLSIQPLVENAIRHGVESTVTGGEIKIEVATTATAVSVSVSNPLPTAPILNGRGHQVGLSSVRARVQAMTQGLGQLETAVIDGRYVATVTLPLSR
ncbi:MULTISPECIES: histidine kinase [unclassified Pseudoxanthomonas]|uniref:sensor histidine kinase n=1 Tax=unclassified Pseudoxanthomonas TaxID=2645906 RepID=UPI0030769BE9